MLILRASRNEMDASPTRRLGLVIGVLVLLAGAGTFLWPYVDGVVGRALLNERTPIDATISVLDDVGRPLPNRLVVFFIEGNEVGRTDASGRLHGLFPRSVHTIGQSLAIREGEIRILSFPPDEQVLAYAFPGDTRTLPFEVQAGRLILFPDGRIGVVGPPPAPSDVARYLMSVLVALFVFPVALRATRHVIHWEGDLKWANPVASYAAGASLTGLSVIMFLATGVIDQWVFRLTQIIQGAVDVMIAAIAISVAILMFGTRIRSLFPPR